MSYSKTTWSVGDTITAAKMNKIEQGVYDAHNGSGSGGGSSTIDHNSCYDLVIKYTGSTWPPTPSDLTLIKGNILDLEAMVANNEPVTGVLYVPYGWSWTVGNTNKGMFILPLVSWFGPYSYLRFGGIYLDGPSSNDSVINTTAAIGYDKNTGAFTHVYIKI